VGDGVRHPDQRITGFIRIVLLAAILGAALSSSFTVANQLPNLVAALVLEATTAIFVPVLARAERDDGDGGRPSSGDWSPWPPRCWR
jgi:putative peptidoglycan lipid II flippase